MKKVAVIESISRGVNHHRLINPLLHSDCEITTYNTIPLDKVNEVECDVLLFSRYMYEKEQAKIITAFKKKGVKVIVDQDDHWELPQRHIARVQHVKNNIARKILEAMRWADEVWTTHAMLAGEIKNYNRNVKVYPNALNPIDEQWIPNPITSSKHRIGFVGGNTHEDDLYETRNAWVAAHSQHNNMEAVLGGANSDSVYGRYQIIMSGGGKGMCRVLAAKDVNNYGVLYDHMDVVIAPLVGSTFNRMRSNLKIIEAGMKATPIICSWMHPYNIDTRGVFVTGNWRKAFNKALRMSKEKLADDGLALREYVISNFDIRNHKRRL